MSGSHAHAHQHHRQEDKRKLTRALILIGVYMLAELAGALYTGSLALLADAGHMLSDTFALGLSLFAVHVAQRRPTPRHTYGFYRAEILAALVNGAALIAVSIYIFMEAWQRFFSPPEILGSGMTAVAAGGLVVNLMALRLLHTGEEASLNLKGAWLHVVTDTLGSVGAIAAGVLIWAFHWNLADPIISVFIALLVLYSSWNLLRESVAVLMEGAPGHVDVDEIRDTILAEECVCAVHDLHVWSIASGMAALSAHVLVREDQPHGTVLSRLQKKLHTLGIAHTTIQIEPPGHRDAHGEPCAESCCD